MSNDGMYSITKEGKIIFIPEDKQIKMDYYEQHYGLFTSEEEAQKEKKRRERVNRHLKLPKDLE